MKLSRALSCLWIGLSAASCGGAPGTRFQGRAEPPIAKPEEIAEQSGQGPELERLGELFASCTPTSVGADAFRDVRLYDLDCSQSRLRRSLREVAAARGGSVLLDARCGGPRGLDCRAGVGRPVVGARTAIPSRTVRLADVRGELGHEVEVDFTPSQSWSQRTPQLAGRAEDNVHEVGVWPVSHVRVGTLETRCAACDELSTRDALRIAAGRLGASDVVGVRCVPNSSGYRCVGEAGLPERLNDVR